jgi:hypothetical protein
MPGPENIAGAAVFRPVAAHATSDETRLEMPRRTLEVLRVKSVARIRAVAPP